MKSNPDDFPVKNILFLNNSATPSNFFSRNWISKKPQVKLVRYRAGNTHNKHIGISRYFSIFQIMVGLGRLLVGRKNRLNIKDQHRIKTEI